MLFAMKPMDRPAKRERSDVSGFTGASSTFQRMARIRYPEVPTVTAASKSRRFPSRMCDQTSAMLTSFSAHQRSRTVTAIPKSALPQCFTRALAG